MSTWSKWIIGCLWWPNSTAEGNWNVAGDHSTVRDSVCEGRS